MTGSSAQAPETSAPAGKILEVTGLTAGYADAMAVRDLTMHVNTGEVVALLGSNGAGKSTTLRAVSGGLTAAAGHVVLSGVDITRRSAQAIARQGVVHMTDRRSIFHGLTVAEHLRLTYRGQRLDAELAYERFPALRALRNRRAGLLSGGEQQMLGLARALARRPRLLLVDEFSLGLAPVIVQRLLPLVRDYVRDTGAAAILVEQHVQLALAVSDRGYILAHGELILTQDADQLISNRALLAESYLGDQAADSQDRPADQGRKRQQ